MSYTVSQEERVNGFTWSRQSAPQTVTLADGSYLTVWSGAGPEDTGYGIYLQRYDTEGEPVGPQRLVNTTTVMSQRNPEVTALANGGFVVTWDSTSPSNLPADAATLGVFAQAFDGAGEPVGPETQVNGVGHSQRVTPLPEGGYVVTWVQHAGEPWSGVFSKRFDAAGQAQGEPWRLDDDLDATLPSLIETDFGFVAVWRAYNEATGGTIAIQSFASEGTRIGQTFRIPRDTDTTAPEVVRLAEGGLALVWTQTDGLYAQILKPDGEPLGDRVLVQAAPPGAQLIHSVVATPDGGFMVAWDQFSGAGSNVVEARAFFADGSPKGATFNVRKSVQAPGEQPGLAVLPSGEVILTYARYVGDLENYFDVFQVRLQPLATTLNGTPSADLIWGTAEADVINGLGGDDILRGGLGNDTLNGNSGDDTLYGQGGDDTMVGGTGDDTYVLIEAGDQIVEQAGEGIDTVQAWRKYRLGDHEENLVLMVSVAGEGNELDNAITGNHQWNWLYGYGGSDVIDGGLGDDNIYGGEGSDVLLGGEGNDWLDSGTGSDAMTGGIGNDTYVVDVAGDTLTELAGEGTDTVRSWINWTLQAEVENLTLLGGAVSGTGNAAGNALTGNAGTNYLAGLDGNDTLDGGAGDDFLYGGLGDDTYVVTEAGDQTIEQAGQGTDTVQAWRGWTLGANLENLTLMAGVGGTGNGLNNLITGNASNNFLSGLGGDDTLVGGAGNDTLAGGSGADTHVFTGAFGQDTVTDFYAAAGVSDMIRFSTDVFADFAAVMAAAADTAGGVVITASGGRRVTLTGVTKAQLSADDFEFVAPSAPLEAKDLQPLTLPGTDPIDDPLILPVGLGPKVGDAGPVVCDTGDLPMFAAPEASDPQGSLRHSHRLAIEEQPNDWIW